MATATLSPKTTKRDKKNREIPPLFNGDHLTRAEFERRYAARPHLKKAELIEGVVYMPSPVHLDKHSKPHSRIIGWLFNYVAATPGTDFGDNATVRLDRENEVQPDAFLRIHETVPNFRRNKPPNREFLFARHQTSVSCSWRKRDV